MLIVFAERTRALNTAFTKASVLGLNAVLLESSDALLESSFSEDTPSVINQGIAHRTVSPQQYDIHILILIINSHSCPTTVFSQLEST